MTSIAVAIVNFNTRDYLDACLQTIRREAPPQTVVVDNGSTDGSIEMVRARHSWVELDLAPANRGYGAAANRAIARCKAPYVLLLNSDTGLEYGALASLTAYMDAHPKAALIGPRVVNPDATLQPSCFPFPTPLTAFLSETDLGYLLRFIPVLRHRYLRTWPHDRTRDVPWVRGAALAIRRDAFEELRGFDERFHMYFEEVDLCYRCRTAGWEVHFAPVTTVVHHAGVSTRQRRAAMLAHYYESMFLFYRQHYSTSRLARLRSVLRGVALARLARDTLRLSLSHAQATRRRLSEDVVLWRELLRGEAAEVVKGRG